MKTWKSGFETYTLDDYTITEQGDIINNRNGGRKVKPQPNGKGYLRVHIAGQMHFVHRLVAEKYIPNPDHLPQVNHKDGNKRNNSADNLEWVTNYENRRHAVRTGLQASGERCPWAKLTAENVRYIRTHPGTDRQTLANQFCVSATTISDVLRRKSWKSV